MKTANLLPTHKVKRAVRKRDRYRCTECGMTTQEHLERYDKQLDVHRLDPGSPYTLEGCVTVCRACHGSKPKGNAADDKSRQGVPLHVWIPPELRDALEALADQNRRPITTEVVIALEKYLSEIGLWPPSD